jgi:hypothetical protein
MMYYLQHTNLPTYLQVLCTSAPKGCQLPQEEVWSQQPAEAQEEDQELVGFMEAKCQNLCIIIMSGYC